MKSNAGRRTGSDPQLGPPHIYTQTKDLQMFLNLTSRALIIHRDYIEKYNARL